MIDPPEVCRNKSTGIILNGTAIAVLCILAFGTWIRFQDLGKMAYHHDESIHAYYSWKLFDKGPYSPEIRTTPAFYDPTYHGPFLYHVGALTFLLFGDSDFTGRLPFAVSGVFLLLIIWELRHLVGKRAAVLILLLAAISPVLTYFARFARNDTYVGAQCLAMIYCALRYFLAEEDKKRFRWLYGMTLALVLHYCTKENSYAHGAIYCSFLGFYGIYYLLVGKWRGPEEFKNRMRVIFDRHHVFVKLYTLYGWFSVFMFSYVILDVFVAPKRFLNWSQNARWSTYWVLAMLVLAGLMLLLGLLRRWAIRDEKAPAPPSEFGPLARTLISNYPLFVSLFIILAVYCFFFTTMFANGDGLRDGVYNYLSHWLKIHDTPRIPGPWWYYMPRLLLYETLGVATWFIALGIYPVWALRDKARGISRPSHYWPLRFFLLFYVPASVAIYCELQEKVTWLLVHQALPMILLAGIFYSDVWERIRSRVVLTIAGTFFVLLALWSLKGNVLVNCYNNDDPKEIMVYTQTDRVVTRIMREIEDICYLTGEGLKTRIVVSGEAQWPFSWYLRNYKNWTITLDKKAAVLVVDESQKTSMQAKLGGKYTIRTYDFRSHWSPDLHSPNNGLFSQNQKKNFWKRIRDYAIYRRIWSDPGSPKINLYVRKDLIPEVEPLEFDLPTGTGEPAQPGQFVRSFGTRGSAQGMLMGPRSVAVGPDGSLYVADSVNARIQKFTPEGQFVFGFGRPGSGEGEFNSGWDGPRGVAVGPDGSIYVADTWNHRVQKFDSSGRFVKMWSGATDAFFGPRDVAVDSRGNVYVVDTGKKRVHKFDSSGAFLRQWGSDGAREGDFDEPVGIAIDKQDQIYIADTGNRRVQVFDENGRFRRSIHLIAWESEDLVGIEPYIAVDGEGRIYVTDSVKGAVHQISSDGKRVTTWGIRGGGPGQLEKPSGIAITAQGEVAVADRNQCRISIFKPR